MHDAQTSDSLGLFRSLWLPSVVVTTVAAGFGVYQVYMFFDRAYPEFYWSRTIAAFAAVAVGIGGAALPLLLIAKRTAYLRWPKAAQRPALILLPVAYTSLFGLLMNLARQSRPVFSTTQTMTLRHAPDDKSALDLDVPGGMSGRGHAHSSDDGEWVAEWECWWLPNTLRDPAARPGLQVQSTGSLNDSGVWDLTVVVTCNRKIVIDVDGFLKESATRDGDAVSFPLLLEPGSHSIRISTRSP